MVQKGASFSWGLLQESLGFFFPSFLGSQGVLIVFPLKFSMGSQFVPQHVLHSSSLLSHMLCLANVEPKGRNSALQK